MDLKKVYNTVAALIAVLIIHSTAIAQCYNVDGMTICFGTDAISLTLTGCDGNSHTITIQGISFDYNTSVGTVRVTCDGRSRTFTLDFDNVYDYDETTGRFNDPQWQAYIDFVGRCLGCYAGLGTFTDVATPADPVVAQNIQSFQSIVFSERSRPRADTKKVRETIKSREAEEEEDEEKEEVAALKPNEMSSDVEYESFEFSGLSGTNLAIRGGYTRTSADGNWSFGANFILNSLSFEEGEDTYDNSSIHLFTNNVFLKTSTYEMSVGASINYLLMDEKTSDENGVAFAAHLIQKSYRGDNIRVYGLMFQQTNIGDIANQYLNVAGMYGFPIGERFSLNIDALYTSNLYTAFDDEEIEMDSKNILNIGVNLSIYMSEAFGMNIGLKKVFLVKDYESLEFTLGAGFRF